MDDFNEHVPSTPQFQIGYMEGNSKQHLILCREDLETMYDSVTDKKEIMLWCDKKMETQESQGSSRKRKSNEGGSKALKVDEQESELIKMVDQLSEKHSKKYTVPQYRLWAKFIQMKRHDSFDIPPNIPLITGTPDSRKHVKKDTVSDALAGAATAIVKALNGSPKKRSNTSESIPLSQGISPNSHANLRRKHLEDIRMLHSLYEDGIISDHEYQEQKENILCTLRSLTPVQNSVHH